MRSSNKLTEQVNQHDGTIERSTLQVIKFTRAEGEHAHRDLEQESDMNHMAIHKYDDNKRRHPRQPSNPASIRSCGGRGHGGHRGRMPRDESCGGGSGFVVSSLDGCDLCLFLCNTLREEGAVRRLSAI